MTPSPEYPDLRWMPPRAWTNADRSSVQLVVIHVTDGAARASAAEDGAAYDQRRTDGVSTHYFHDCDSTIQCVRTEDRAHAARTQGNIRGIQHELCTRADTANWADAYHQAMLRRAARQAARDARKWKIPVRHLTVAQVADGEKGFCGHVDVTRAFPEDRGTHTDPGSAFPWSQFLTLVRAELDPTNLEDDDMPSAKEIAEAVWAHTEDVNIGDNQGTGKPSPQQTGDILRYCSYEHHKLQLAVESALDGVNAIAKDLTAMKASLDAALSQPKA